MYELTRKQIRMVIAALSGDSERIDQDEIGKITDILDLAQGRASNETVVITVPKLSDQELWSIR